MQVIRCGDMQSYYATFTEMALLNSVIEPQPLQVVLDYWLAEIVYHLKERN
jgi:hypothetical protein